MACETATTTGMVFVFGEITTKTYVDISGCRSENDRKIGYTHSKHGFDAKTCGVIVAIKEQSPEISQRRGRVARGPLWRRRRSVRPGRRWRPGHDDRLRLQRDARADAAADLAGPQDLPPARRGAQERRASLAAAGRQGQVTVEYHAASRRASTRSSSPPSIAARSRNDEIERDDRREGHPPGRAGGAARRRTPASSSTRAADS